MNYLRLYVVCLLVLVPLAAAQDHVAVSLLGKYPGSPANVIVFTHDTTGTAYLHDAATDDVVETVTLTVPTDFWGESVSCQGNLHCIRGSILTDVPGEYYVSYGTATSSSFPISTTIYEDTFPLYLEWFNAHMMQNSSYHAQYFGYEDPDFMMMADGAFLMEASQASIPLIRLSQAYHVNPSLFESDAHDVLAPNTPDGIEYIQAHVQYLRSLQADNGMSNEYMVPVGYTRPWGPWFDTHPDVPRYTTSQPSFIVYSHEVRPQDTPQAAFAYLMAVPAIESTDHEAAQELLVHSLETIQYYAENHPATSSEEAAYLGAAYFMAYNETGNWTYLDLAHELREDVDRALGNDYTKGNEFYWLLYAQHENEIIALGHEYRVNDQDPVEFLRGKLYYDYKDRGALSISATGERVYEFDPNIQFSNSRYMLLEAVYAATVAEHFSSEPFIDEIADAQLAWLTGLNAVQHRQHGDELRPVTFISGIGRNYTEIHSRITPPRVRTGEWTFSNGMTHIPGWINGAYDYSGDADIIRNYDEISAGYRHTETTNEMVVLAAQLTAMRDAYYNDKPGASWGYILDQRSPWPDRPPFVPPPDSPPATCSTSLAGAVATCDGGTIISDSLGGCRGVTCESDAGLLSVLACDKTTAFEMYKLVQTDPALEVCLDGTCIAHNGFARSNDYATCETNSTPMNGSITVMLSITNDDGGSLLAQDVELAIDGVPVLPEVAYEHPAGNYLISSTSIDNYTISFSQDCDSTGIVELDEAQHATCVVHYNDVGDTVCVQGLQSIPVTCSGTIVADTMAGCRTVTCEGDAGSQTVMACDKPGSANPTHFEVYKQAAAGTLPEICFADVCMTNEGFVRSPDYPICTSGPLCTDNDLDTFASQGGVCGPLDCNDLDGSIHPAATETCNLIDDNCNGQIDEGGVCPEPVCGNSIVEQGEQCDDGNTQSGDGCDASCQLELTASTQLSIAPWFPQGASYVFVCEAEGMSPDRYDFFFGDGNQNIWRGSNDVYYTYTSSGNYTVSCAAHEGELMVSDSLSIVVG